MRSPTDLKVLPHELAETFVAALLLMSALSACSTPDPENASARPWNQPRGWGRRPS